MNESLEEAKKLLNELTGEGKKKISLPEAVGMLIFGIAVTFVEAFALYSAWIWFFVGAGITTLVLPYFFIFGMLWVRTLLSKQSTIENKNFKGYMELLTSRLLQILLVFGILFLTSFFI